jgi:hypothetical protein
MSKARTPTHRACRHLIALATSLLFLCSTAWAQTQVDVFVDSFFVPTYGNDDQTIKVTGTSTQAVKVDVYVGLFSPSGQVYTFRGASGFGSGLQPWVRNVSLGANSAVGPFSAFKLSQFGTMSPGIWQAAIGLTPAGAPPTAANFIAYAFQPFQVVNDAAGTGTVYGFVGLSRLESAFGTELNAAGGFIDVSGGLADLVSSYAGATPQLDKCVLNEVPVNLNAITDLTVETRDAGPALRIIKGRNTLGLPKDPDAAAYGYELYGKDDVVLSFYQGGANYRFAGNGGPEIGAFSVPVKAPAPLSLTSPKAIFSYQHNAGTPLQLAWNGANKVGEVSAILSGLGTGVVVSIDCRFTDDGRAAVPAGLLTAMRNKLSGGFPGNQVSLDVSRVNTAPFNTNRTDLNVGLATIATGTSLQVNLQ